MKTVPNGARFSSLLCGALLIAMPSFAAGAGGTAGGGIGAGPTTGAAGTSPGTGVNTTGQVTAPAGALNKNSAANANAAAALSKSNRFAAGKSTSNGALSNNGGDLNSTTAGNNAGSVDMSTQAPAKHASRKARAGDDETTRQLNRRQAQLNEQPKAPAANR